MERPAVRYAVLRDLRNWEGATWTGLDAESDGVLQLARVPGPVDGQAVVRSGSYDVVLSGIAVGACCDLVIPDTEQDSISFWAGGDPTRRVRLGERAGEAPGQFRAPRSVALSRERLYVADSGNARVMVFRLPTLELVDIWEGFVKPVGLALDASGRVSVLDRASVIDRGTVFDRFSGRVVRFDAHGRVDSKYNLAIGATLAEALPAAIAIDAEGVLFVTDARSNTVLRFDADGQVLSALPQSHGPALPRAIAAHERRLYVADVASGAVWVHDRLQGWVGRLPGYCGPVSALACDGEGRLYVKPGLDSEFALFEADRAAIAVGTLEAGPLDAGDESEWERVVVEAELPEGATAELRLWYASTAERSATEAEWALDERRAAALDALVPPLPGLVAVVPGSKRYLWLRLALRSMDALASPRVLQIQAATVAASYLDYLPAVYRRDDTQNFLARWLSLFRSDLSDWERSLADVPRHFDAATAPESELTELASWLGFELPERTSPEEWRRLIGEIHRLYERRGTPFGMREFCELYTGVRPHLFEVYRERHVWRLDQTSRLGFDTALPAAAPEGMVVAGFSRSDPASQGLLGDYYGGANFDKLLRSRVDTNFDFDWRAQSPLPGGVPVDGFSARWTGQLLPRHTETYTFSVATSAGVRLWIGGRLVIDDWDHRGFVEHTGRAALSIEHWSAVKLEVHAETATDATVTWSWLSRNQVREVVPAACLYALIDEWLSTTTEPDAGAGMLVGQTVVGASGPLLADDYGAPLFQETAHLFTALLPAARVCSSAQRHLLEQVIESEKPAHSDFHLCLVGPRLRVGFQARVGVDAIVAGPPEPMTLSGTVLDRDSYLGDSDSSGASRVGQRAHLGRDTRVQ